MIEQIEIESVSGKERITVPQCQFKINDNQNIVVIGLPQGRYSEIDEKDNPDYEYVKMGRLSNDNGIFTQIITNNLEKENWDWDKHPNPEVIIISKKK